MFVSRIGPRYTEPEARAAVAASLSHSEALRRLGMRAAGGNHATLKKWIERWGIPTDHFDLRAVRRASRAVAAIPLKQLLVRRSAYSRQALKRRLYAEGLKTRVCELCGQGELWREHRMSLILDHINGVADDNRLENLRIVCPNCAATLDTHCGRNTAMVDERTCLRCGVEFRAKYNSQRYCSGDCGSRWPRKQGVPRPETRRVVRPPYGQLVREVTAFGFLATGRRYGVSDNAIRKWLRMYEKQEEARTAGV
jgi:hypothetical protein